MRKQCYLQAKMLFHTEKKNKSLAPQLLNLLNISLFNSFTYCLLYLLRLVIFYIFFFSEQRQITM